MEKVGSHLQAVAGPQRTGDVFAWQRAVREAGDIGLERNDGRTLVSHQVVKAVLHVMATYADGKRGKDPGGNIRPGLAKLAANAGYSRTHVQRAIAAGIVHGYLVQLQSGQGGGGRGRPGRTPIYALTLPKVASGHREGCVGTSPKVASRRNPPPQLTSSETQTRQTPQPAAPRQPPLMATVQESDAVKLVRDLDSIDLDPEERIRLAQERWGSRPLEVLHRALKQSG